MTTKTDTKISMTRPGHFWRGNIVTGGGRHRHLTASGSRVLTAALLDRPEVAAADAALHRYGRCVDALVEAAREPSPVTPSAIAQRFADEDVDPSAFREAAEQAHRRAQLVTIERGVVQEVGVELWASRDLAFDNALPAGIQTVSGSFVALVDRLREAGITEADADGGLAVEHGRVAEYKLLSDALPDYRGIRLGAAAVLNDAGIMPDPEGSQAFWVVALLARPLDVDKWWPVRAAGLGVVNKTTGERISPATAVIPELDGIDGLAWIASHDVGVRVASPAAYRASRGAMSKAKDLALHAATPGLVLMCDDTEPGWRVLDANDPRATGPDVWTVFKPASRFE